MATVDGRYQSKEVYGVTAIIVASLISLISVITLFSLLAWITITGRGPMRPFLRTHTGAYSLSLMTADLIQTFGGIMDIKWVAARHVFAGRFCTAQAAIKQFSSVGAALWTIVIAIHTFRLLFFNSPTSNRQCFITLVVVWGGIIALVAVGPTVIESKPKGNFFGVTGHWCWITHDYQIERLVLQYLLMFIAAGVSFITYTMIFFRLRGNLVTEGCKIKFFRVHPSRAWNLETGDAALESQTMSIAWQMMWYPLSYTFTILPISASRWAEFSGVQVPFSIKTFSSAIFMLSGFVNTIVFIMTRRVLPPLKLRNKPTSGFISISIHATRTQQTTSPHGQSPYTVVLSPESTYTEGQEYELQKCSHLPIVPE